MTSITLHLECSNWLAHGFNIPVSNSDGLTESEAIEYIKEEYPVCPKCGKNWKKNISLERCLKCLTKQEIN